LLENTILCGQVDAEMAGQTVLVAGMVAFVAHLVTKQQKALSKPRWKTSTAVLR